MACGHNVCMLINPWLKWIYLESNEVKIKNIRSPQEDKNWKMIFNIQPKID